MRHPFLGLILACGCSDTVLDKGVGSDDTGTDTGEVSGAGVIVLAGGGSEGEKGDDAAWSARLYAHLLDGGDVTGDGQIHVAVLADSEQTDWLPDYFETLGADLAFNLTLSTTLEADDAGLDELMAEVDAVFIKGGDQGEYYDLWNDRRIETLLRDLVARGGGIGGTSAGAMSQAGYALAGGADLVSADVLTDACSEYLEDVSDGGPGVHDDFLGFLPDVLIDTHFVERARLGRLAGAMALAIHEGAPPALLGIGLEAATGVWISDGRATVVGDGSVSFLRASEESLRLRSCGAPLIWTGLELDVLTDGWVWDLGAGRVDEASAPPDAEAVAWDGDAAENLGEWYVDGDTNAHEERFAVAVTRFPGAYATAEGDDPPVLEDAIGVMNAHDSERRAANHEALLRALHDHPGYTGFLVATTSSLGRADGVPAEVRFEDNPYEDDAAMSTLVLDSAALRWRSLSPAVSAHDAGDGALHAAGLIGMRLHVLADSDGAGLVYDSEAHAVRED